MPVITFLAGAALKLGGYQNARAAIALWSFCGLYAIVALLFWDKTHSFGRIALRMPRRAAYAVLWGTDPPLDPPVVIDDRPRPHFVYDGPTIARDVTIGTLRPQFNRAISAFQPLTPVDLKADFAVMHVANDPDAAAHPVISAREVVARITYSHDGPDIVVNGRWGGSTKQVAALQPGDPIEPLDAIDFAPTGQRKELDLALKYPGDLVAYAYSNRSPLEAADFRVDDFKLKGSPIRASVRLRGDGIVDEVEWRFLMTHDGKGSRLTVTPDAGHKPTLDACATAMTSPAAT